MKKLIALIIMLAYTSLNTALAFSELYYVKDVYTDSITPIIREKYESNDFRIMKADPYYGVSTKDSSEYAVIILQQSGTNMFYYYQSNDNKKLNNSILKELKRQGITYEKSENANIISLYDSLAGELTNQTSQTNRYTFEEPKPQYQTSNQNNTVSYDTQNSLRGSVAQIATGTKLNVYLQSSINTATANKGDQITAVLMKDVTYNGAVVFPQGSLIYGTLTKAVHASYGSRNGKVVISFNQIVTPENKSYNITAENIDFAVTNEGKLSSSVSNVAVGAAVGALAGLLFAALAGGDRSLGKAAAIGAGIGAGGALISSTAERGVDAEIPSFTEMELVLTKPISVTVSY